MKHAWEIKNNAMTPEERIETEPSLAATPWHLEFGTFDLEQSLASQTFAILTITNNGGGQLAGRINPQTSWLKVEPPNFCCSPGESSKHRVILLPETPHSWQGQHYSHDFLLLINSNGGSFFIGGSYTARPSSSTPPKKKANLRWMVIPLLSGVFLFALVIGLLFLLLTRQKKQPVEPAALFTQGAKTVIAELTLTAAPPVPGLLQEIAVQFKQETPAPPFAADNAIPSFTPWPREQYPNPEQFIKDYYQEINNRNYERSWSMLSKKFQGACCSVAGNDPYQVYRSWWDTIASVDTTSSYLQAWDTNPAEVFVTLKYITQKGETIEAFNTFLVIADPVKNSLLIDEVR